MKYFLFFLFAIAVALQACNNTPTPASTTDTEAATTPAEKADAAYSCPMKCEGEKTYDKPGKCPVCKMDLVAVSEHEDDEHEHSEEGEEHEH